MRKAACCAALAAVLLCGPASAQGTGGNITGPEASPRVPEAATDIPVHAPGPSTGTPSAATSKTGEPPSTTAQGPLEPKEAVRDSSNMPKPDNKPESNSEDKPESR